jgi:predicted Zn-dependent peptidase
MNALFGDWAPAAGAAPPASVPWQRVPQSGVYLLPGDFSQCHVRIGRPIPELTERDPDYPLVRLLDFGVGINRIYLRTRQEGLSYGTATRLTADAHWGQFFGFGSTRPEGLMDLLRAIREEVAAVAERPLDADEITASRTFLLGNELRAMETLSGMVNRRLGDLVCGRGEDAMARMVAGLQAADEASLAAAAARWVGFGPAPVLLVVGAPEGGAAALESLGLGPVTVLEPVRFGE